MNIKERVAEAMYRQHVTQGFEWKNEGDWFQDKYRSYADQIIPIIEEYVREKIKRELLDK